MLQLLKIRVTLAGLLRGPDGDVEFVGGEQSRGGGQRLRFLMLLASFVDLLFVADEGGSQEEGGGKLFVLGLGLMQDGEL